MGIYENIRNNFVESYHNEYIELSSLINGSCYMGNYITYNYDDEIIINYNECTLTFYFKITD